MMHIPINVYFFILPNILPLRLLKQGFSTLMIKLKGFRRSLQSYTTRIRSILISMLSFISFKFCNADQFLFIFWTIMVIFLVYLPLCLNAV